MTHDFRTHDLVSLLSKRVFYTMNKYTYTYNIIMSGLKISVVKISTLDSTKNNNEKGFYPIKPIKIHIIQ